MKARHDIDWRPLVGRVVWVPDGHRTPTISTAAAIRMLRCTPSSFDALLDLGLRGEEGSDGLTFDICDLRNAALYSQSGVTDMEIAMATIFGYMKSATADLIAERSWTYTVTVHSDPDSVPESEQLVSRPTPEDFGGALVTCRTPEGRDVELVGDRMRVRAGTRVGGMLVTRGLAGAIRSAAIRRLALEVIDSGIRWHSLPATLDLAPDEALALGVGGCVTLSVALERHLCNAGFNARSYWGWLAGAVNTMHTWVEVQDDDGSPKWIDPALALIGGLGGQGTADFVRFVVGSATNRVVPTHHPVLPIAGRGMPMPFLLDFACQAGRSVTMSAGASVRG